MKKFFGLTVFSLMTLSLAALATDAQPQGKQPSSRPYVVYPPRVLSVEIKYQDQTTEKKTVLVKVNESLKTMVGAYKAIPVGDEFYETRLFSSRISPYVPASLYEQAVKSGACDLNAVGPCIVVEKDSVTGKNRERAYFIGTAPSKKRVDGINIARIDIDTKKFKKEIDSLIGEKSNGIYVFSAAATPQEAKDSAGNVVDIDHEFMMPAAAPIYVSNATYFLAKNVKIEGVNTEQEKMQYWKTVEQIVQASTTFREQPLPPAAMNSCWVSAEMVQTRAFFILDVVGLVDGSKTPSRVSTKATLHCELADGKTVQNVSVKVKEYSHFRLGFVFTEGRQKSLSMGLGGYANDALDILTVHDFASIVQGCADIPLVSVCYAPVVLANQPGRDGILSSTPSANVGQLNLNATLSLGDTMTVEAEYPR